MVFTNLVIAVTRLKTNPFIEEVMKCETKINQNVQKKTNLKTSLNNLEKIE